MRRLWGCSQCHTLGQAPVSAHINAEGWPTPDLLPHVRFAFEADSFLARALTHAVAQGNARIMSQLHEDTTGPDEAVDDKELQALAGAVLSVPP